MRGLVTDLTSEAYHSMPGTFSSSQLKTILEDPEMFYRKYITHEIGRESIPAFDIGTYFHTAILEPEKLTLECAVYTGIRRGKEWESFKLLNEGKAIITSSELDQAKTLIKAVEQSKVAQSYLSQGKPEISCFADLYVYAGEIYCNGLLLTKDGWVETTGFESAHMHGKKIVIKVRADLLGDTGFILDLKSTTGNVKDSRSMRAKVSSFSYDLSAALYLDIFTAAGGRIYHTFIWTFASKDYGNCQNYVASETNIKIGRAKWSKAIHLLAANISSDWKFEDEILDL
jgi:hypothetical protein